MVQFVTLGAHEMHARRAMLYTTTERFSLDDFHGRINQLDDGRARIRRHESLTSTFAGYSEDPRKTCLVATSQTLAITCTALEAIECAGDAAKGVALSMLFELVQRQRHGGGLTLSTDHNISNVALVANGAGVDCIVAFRYDLTRSWKVRVLKPTARVRRGTRVITLDSV